MPWISQFALGSRLAFIQESSHFAVEAASPISRRLPPEASGPGPEASDWQPVANSQRPTASGWRPATSRGRPVAGGCRLETTQHILSA